MASKVEKCEQAAPRGEELTMPTYLITVTRSTTLRVEAKDAYELDDKLNQWDVHGFEGIDEALADVEVDYDVLFDKDRPDGSVDKPARWRFGKYGDLERIPRTVPVTVEEP